MVPFKANLINMFVTNVYMFFEEYKHFQRNTTYNFI